MALSSGRLCYALERTVKVTLKCGVFQGVLQHVNPDRSLLLRTVKNLETGRRTPGIKMFFSHEIVNVEVLDEPGSGDGTAMLLGYVEVFPSFHGRRRGGMPLLGEPPLTFSVILMFSSAVPEKKEEENVEYTVVDCFQQKFGPAVLHLKQQGVVSIAGEGVNLSRHGKLSWLEMATKSHTFLFDIFLLGPQAFKNGLQMVLEDKNVLKVMHDCRWISDCLFHQYGVLLFNVFDTQVADALQFSMATGGFLPHRVSTFQECMTQHLKIPPQWDALLKHRQQMASMSDSVKYLLKILENPDIWFSRPFPACLLKVLALKATYLLLLHSALMESLLSDLTAVVHQYLDARQSGAGDHLGGIKPSCLELPGALRQLADIQKLRREKAIKDYRMNEDGFLIRPAMELKEGNSPWKDGNSRDDRGYFPTNKAASQLLPSYSRDVLCEEKLENQNQVVNLWKDLKPTQSWLHKSDF